MPTSEANILISATTASEAAQTYGNNQAWQEDLTAGLDFFAKATAELEKNGKIESLPNAPSATQLTTEGAAFIGSTVACVVGVVGSAAAGAGAPLAVAGCAAAVTSFIKLFTSIKKLKAYWVARDNRNEEISNQIPVFTYICANGKQDFQAGAVNCANAAGRFDDIVFIQNSGYWKAFLAYAWFSYCDAHINGFQSFEAQLHQLGNSQPLGGQAWTIIRDRNPQINATWDIERKYFSVLTSLPIVDDGGPKRSWATLLGAFDFSRWEWLQKNETEKAKYLLLYNACMVLGGFRFDYTKDKIDLLIGQASQVALARSKQTETEKSGLPVNSENWYWWALGAFAIIALIYYFLNKK